MYQSFGAHDVNGQAEFSIYFPGPHEYDHGGDPQIAKLEVFGTFQSKLGRPNWSVPDALPLTAKSHGSGVLWSGRTPALPEGFYEYKYIVTFKDGASRKVSDPCTRYSGGEHENSGLVIGGSTPQDNLVQRLDRRLPLRDLVIYELMIDDFTAEYRGPRAPVDAVVDKLDYIRSIGFNAIEFMPWTAWIGGDFAWGYLPFLFFSVENRYVDDPREPAEKLSRLKRLITECHRRGLHVIMDGVFDHARYTNEAYGFPYYWLYRDPNDSPFVGIFADSAFPGDLNFANKCTNVFIADVCKYWIDLFGIDGLRLDYTKGLYLPAGGDGAPAAQPPPGLPRLIADVRAHVAGHGEDEFSITIEHIEDYNAIDVANKVDATSCWYDPFYWTSRTALKRGWIDADIMRLLNTSQDFGAGRVPTTYIENHDHAEVASNASGRANWFRLQPWMIALLTCPGAVLVYNGQEFADDYWMPEMHEEQQSGQARVTPRPKRWAGQSEDEIAHQVRDLYRRLIRIRHDHPALRGPQFHPAHWEGWQRQFDRDGYGVDVGKQAVIYHRWGPGADGATELFIVVLNFSPWTQELDIPFANNGEWVDLLSGWRVSVDNWRLPNQRIGGNWGHVFYRRA